MRRPRLPSVTMGQPMRIMVVLPRLRTRVRFIRRCGGPTGWPVHQDACDRRRLHANEQRPRPPGAAPGAGTQRWSPSPDAATLARVTIERVDPPVATDEATTLLAFLDYHRDTLRTKVDGLTQSQLAQPLIPSSLTLGGLLKHLALVEASWFGEVLHGRPMGQPWDSVDWDGDPDWEFRTAADDSPEQLGAMLDAAVEQSRRNIEEALLAGGLDQLSVGLDRKGGQRFSLRWILLHLIEEYARHNGHADYLREAIDGVTGE